MPELKEIMRTLTDEGFGAFIVVEGLTSLSWFRSLFLIGILMSIFCRTLSL